MIEMIGPRNNSRVFVAKTVEILGAKRLGESPDAASGPSRKAKRLLRSSEIAASASAGTRLGTQAERARGTRVSARLTTFVAIRS
jgi:hypothetical protein